MFVLATYKNRFLFACVAGTLAFLSACGSDGLDVLDIEIPAGYELSAGTSTIFLNSSVAYDSEAPWVKGDYLTRFVRGDREADSAPSMPDIPAEAATATPAAHAPASGATTDPVHMASRPCSSISPERTVRFSATTDECSTTRLSMV